MSDNELRSTPLVPLTVSQFIDRAFEAERRWTEAEFQRRDAQLAAYAQMDILRHEAGDAKIQQADKVLSHRLEEMNNFRAQISQERVEYMRRDMHDREHASLSERVKTLEIVGGEQSGKAAAYASMVGIGLVLVQVASHFWK
jgi:biopolymer transport protein ExbB/TolQ